MSADILFTPKHNWQLKNCRIVLTKPDTQYWAKFILENMTKKNKEYLSGVMPIMVKNFGWLDETVAGLFSAVIEDRVTALIKAIDNGELPIENYPSVHYQRERNVIGAACCELIAQQLIDKEEVSEFFRSID